MKNIFLIRLVGCIFTAVLFCGFAVNEINAEEVKPAIVEALNNGDTASAISLLNNEIAVDKAYHYNFYVLGMIRYNQGRIEEARDLFLTALDKKKSHLESKYYLGLCYIELENLDEALKQMEAGRKKAKNGLKNIFENGYGLVMMAKKDYQAADLAFRQAIVGDSTIAEYHINLGDANFYSGVPYLAMMEYEKALQLDTAGLEVYFHWAEACLEAKDYTCAIEKLRTVLTKDSTHAPAWMRAGEIYFKAGLSSRTMYERNERFKETIGSYKRFLELDKATPDSSNVRVFFGLAMAYVNLNGFEDAVKYFDDVLSIPYEARDIYFNYGKSLWGMKDFVKSAEMLLKHIEWVKEQGEGYTSRIPDVELYQLLGDDYFYRDPKDYSTAIGYYKKSLEENPNQNRILQNVAIGYHTLQSYAQAIEYYDKRIEQGIDSSSMNIIKNAAYCALNLANQAGEGGDEGFVDEDEIDPTPPPNPDELYRKAVDYMTQYLQYDPSDSKAMMMVANTNLYQLGNCEEGVKYFQQLLTFEPDNCDAKKSLGYAYFGGICNKNYTKALGYLKDAYECIRVSADGGPCFDVPLVLWVAQCYHLRAADKSKEKEGSGEDDFREAHSWYGKVLKCDPNHAEAKKNRDEIQFEFSEK